MTILGLYQIYCQVMSLTHIQYIKEYFVQKKKPIIEINYHDFHYLNLTWQSTELWEISHKVEDRDRSRHRPLSSEDLDYADDLGLLSNRHQDIQQTLTLLSVGLDFFYQIVHQELYIFSECRSWSFLQIISCLNTLNKQENIS